MQDSYVQGVIKRRIDQVRIGDRIDLENDRYADPQGFRGVESNHPEFAFEFGAVREIERETPTCIRLDFDNFSCGFPPDHEIAVDGEQIRNSEETEK